MHCVSGVGADPGPDAQFGRMLQWLTGCALQFAPCRNPCNIARLPGFAFGIEMSAQRLGTDAFDMRMPVSGLLLAGQDVSGPGIQAACMSGLPAAAAIEPSLLRRLGG